MNNKYIKTALFFIIVKQVSLDKFKIIIETQIVYLRAQFNLFI